MSSANLVLIRAGIAIELGVGYFIYVTLTDPSPSGQLANARLGLDKYPGIGLLSDEKVRD
jgi:hypothetical protein